MEKPFILDDNVEHSTPSPLYIPTEVCKNVVNMLFSVNTEETLTNIATLHSCAFICRDWHVRSQRRLFYLVQLSDSTSLHCLSTILDNGPHLHDYVYCVELTGYHLHNTTSIFALFPHVFAGKLPNLAELDVGSPRQLSLPKPTVHRSFTTVLELYLVQTTFRSFSELPQTIRALTNLQQLTCVSVHWISTGGSHPGADFMQQPDWATGRHTLPPFVPKIRRLWLSDIALYGAERLILMNRQHLKQLDLMIPLSDSPEEPTDGMYCTILLKQLVVYGGNDLSSCTALEKLVLWLMPQFSVDTHGEFVTALLASWKPRCLEPLLVLQASIQTDFTCRAFADVLRSVGAITETWLQTVEQAHPTDGSVNAACMKYKLVVWLCDWETEKEWWSDHVDSCFPTWLQLERLSGIFNTRACTLDSGY
ncbi:hypothetical protein V8D89_001315 [Ganoderma adspersum]